MSKRACSLHILCVSDSRYNTAYIIQHIWSIAQLVSALDLVTSSVQVEGSILTAGKRLSLKNLNVIIRAIN